MITEDQFDSIYQPMTLTPHGDVLAPHYKDARAFAEQSGLDENHVWSIMEGEDDSLSACPGHHVVNIIGFVVTRKPWETGNEVAVYMKSDMDDLDMEPEPAPGM